MNPESLFVDVPGLRLHVTAWGSPANPVLFLLHGMRDHSRSWDWIAQAFADSYRVYAPDLRGHGDSGWTSAGAYGLPNYIADLDDIAKALGAEKFAIVGHSFGGAIGLRYSSVFPEKVTGFAGIECVELPHLRAQRDTPRPYPVRLREWIEGAAQLRTRQARAYPSFDDAEARMIEEFPTLPRETVGHLARHAVIATAAGGLRWKFDNAARLRAPEDAAGFDLDEMLEAIACPVLLTYGTGSWVPIPPTERLARIRKLSLIQFPGDSHWLHHTSRADFIDAVRSFLTDLPERSLHA